MLLKHGGRTKEHVSRAIAARRVHQSTCVASAWLTSRLGPCLLHALSRFSAWSCSRRRGAGTLNKVHTCCRWF